MNLKLNIKKEETFEQKKKRIFFENLHKLDIVQKKNKKLFVDSRVSRNGEELDLSLYIKNKKVMTFLNDEIIIYEKNSDFGKFLQENFL